MSKRLIATILMIVTLFTLSVNALANNVSAEENSSGLSASEEAKIQREISDFTSDTIKSLSLEELQYAATVAETDNEATVVFDALVDKYAVDSAKVVSKASLISNYVQSVSVSKSGQNVTVKYRIKAKIPSGASISLGYEFPSAVKTNGQYVSLSGKKIGEYTQKFTIPTLMCQSRISVKMTARDYKETKVFKTFNYKSKVYTDYHTVTKAEVTGYWALYNVAPFVACKIYPGSKLIKIVGMVASAGSATFDVTGSYSLNIGVPKPVTGQYYKTETWYADNKIYARVRVWNSQSAFKNGDLPSYNGKKYVKTNLPTF